MTYQHCHLCGKDYSPFQRHECYPPMVESDPKPTGCSAEQFNVYVCYDLRRQEVVFACTDRSKCLDLLTKKFHGVLIKMLPTNSIVESYDIELAGLPSPYVIHKNIVQ